MHYNVWKFLGLSMGVYIVYVLLRIVCLEECDICLMYGNQETARSGQIATRKGRKHTIVHSVPDPHILLP